MSVTSKKITLSTINCDDWWGGNDFQLEPAKPPPVEWGYIPKSPFTGRSSSRSGRRPTLQEYTPNARPKTAPVWSGSTRKEVGKREWDNRHHITFGKNNPSYPSSLREYFPPKPKVPVSQISIHSPKFSHDIWRQADPYLADEVSLTGSTCESIEHIDSIIPSDSSIASRRSPGGTMRNATGEVETWDDRASTSISKDNVKLHSNQREYFFYGTSSFSSPPDYYHNQKWRNLSPGKSRQLEMRKQKPRRRASPV